MDTGKRKSRFFFFAERKRTLADLVLACLIDSGKSPAANKVLLALRYLSDNDHTARATPGVVAEVSGLSRWSVRRGLDDLSKARIISDAGRHAYRLWTGPAHVLGRLVKEDQKRPYAEQKISPRLLYWVKKHETQDKNSAERKAQKRDRNVIGKDLLR